MFESIAFLHPKRLSKPGGMFSPGVRIERPGVTLYVAGQIAAAPDGSTVGEGDFAAQVRQVFLNIGVVLDEAGMDFGDIVKFTTYIVGAEHVPMFVETRGELFPELFGEGPYPANTLIVIDRLARPQFLVEIEAVAVRSASDS
ncbi:MAG TPA: Rid family hydrolase [Acidimicrobiales bacterium]|nr:Rid family hydrolase [Acidimicrobiales bacterium]